MLHFRVSYKSNKATPSPLLKKVIRSAKKVAKEERMARSILRAQKVAKKAWALAFAAGGRWYRISDDAYIIRSGAEYYYICTKPGEKDLGSRITQAAAQVALGKAGFEIE